MTNTKKLLTAGLASFLVLTALPFAVSADTANSTVEVSVSSTLSTFTTSGTVTLGGLTPDATGRQSINNDTVTVDTNNSAGYTLTLEDADADHTLASGADTFAAASGTPGTPATLANNTWGWRVDGLSSFGAGPTSVTSNTAPSSLTFAGIPADSSPFTIQTTSSNGSSSVDVWYSARADNTQPTGAYSGVVTYTATTN